MDANPLCIILVKNGSRGDRLLFRYPYSDDNALETKTKAKRHNPYSMLGDGTPQTSTIRCTSNISNGKLTGFSDKVMSNLFALKSELCDRKFELKVNDVRFVGHPVRLNPTTTLGRHQDRRKPSTIILFNIVFALKATLNHDVVNCYHDLSMRLGLALRHEEYRCQFLSSEARIMLAAHDEASQLPEDGQISPFQLILDRSLFARHLRQVYEELCGSGIVQLRLNKWIQVSFCLPQKVHHSLATGEFIDYEGLLRGLQTLKPYHTLLLLVERSELLRSLSADASPALRRLLHVESALTPFYTLAADADLTLPQVFMLVGHLVYWGKGTIIYPVCSTNVYVLSPNAPTVINSQLAERFSEQFPGSSLHAVLAEFSFPISLSDKCHPMTYPHQQQEQVQQVLWLLKHGLLQQLHTYVYLAPPPTSSDSGSGRLSGREIGGTGQLGSHGTSSPASTSIPTPTVHEPPPLSHDPPSLTPHPQQSHQADIIGDALHHAAVQLSQPASESDLGSVCSDERSPSPGVSLNTIPEDYIRRRLDTFLSPAEKEMVMKVEAAQNPEDLKLFAKLCVYFRGRHHLEEMMYRANLWRSELLQAIDKFRQVLITCQHPDDSFTLTAHTK
ncbi:GATOR1 complex protein NPRL3 [Penaeus vannamei]|uniref:GATOR1 complex protein NPRL3 n=1 Tax=Penaeus vannamei TaxID=6689 RepID=UPI000F664D6E|nr:GATOR complex protein NPRL3-like [Penaeus vannamei]